MTSSNATAWAGTDTHTDAHTIALLDGKGKAAGHRDIRGRPGGIWRLIGALPEPGMAAAIGVGRELVRRGRRGPRRHGRWSTGPPKSPDGWVEALRHLNAQRAQLASAMTTIPDSANGLLVTAPESVRERYRGLRGGDRMNGLAECRPAGGLVERSAPAALKSTAKAWKALKRQSGPLEERMRAILQEHARPSPDMYCAGIVIAAALAIVAGDDPERIRSEAAFAKLCGACPLPASSGRTNRHRLNKGGNRQGDMALRRIAIVRLRYHQPTRDHAAGKTREGEGRLENIRCVKRFIAREACRVLIAIRNGGIGRRMPAERGAGLREPRVGHGITHSRSTRRHACRSAASERSNEANGTCPNSSDGPSNGFTPSPVQNNAPKRLTMYRSIKTHGTPKFT